jgi:hypothetical protein
MGNIMCENYYCQSVSFKPEWFSEASWKIEYNIEKKPYIIDKGIIKINNTEKFNLLLSKKLLIDFNENKNISIPINFKYYIPNIINIYIIFSNKELLLNDMSNLDIKSNDFFFINLKAEKNKISVINSFDSNIIDKKIKSKRNNKFIIDIENNFNLLLLNESVIDHKLKNIYNYKCVKQNTIDLNKLFLSLYIVSNNNILNKDFIELNFE